MVSTKFRFFVFDASRTSRTDCRTLGTAADKVHPQISSVIHVHGPNSCSLQSTTTYAGTPAWTDSQTLLEMRHACQCAVYIQCHCTAHLMARMILFEDERERYGRRENSLDKGKRLPVAKYPRQEIASERETTTALRNDCRTGRDELCMTIWTA